MIIGFQRAVFSNEAGIGSASIAHSAVRTDEPVTEGVVSLLEPFIDTIVICTITALVIGTAAGCRTRISPVDATGVAMTSAAFEREFSWFPIPLAFAALLFAFSTMISWSYYGLKGWTYMFGESAKEVRRFTRSSFAPSWRWAASCNWGRSWISRTHWYS